MTRTRTSRITHSELFLRSRARRGGAVAGEPPLSYESAQSAFMALFDQFEDIDQLVRDCVATLPAEATAVAKRVHGGRGHSRRARNGRDREAIGRQPSESGQGQGRR